MSGGINGELAPYIGAEIPSLVDFLRDAIKTQTDQNIPFEVMALWLSTYVENHKEEHFYLSKTRPDFESVKIQFIARVKQTTPWKDVITSAWAQRLSEFFAAISDYAQTSILRAYQEAGNEARLSSSIYMQMRGLGVPIDRAIPAHVSVELWGDFTDETIPELSKFNVGSRPFFNREPVQFNNNTDQTKALTTTLYQGDINTESYISRGVPFQVFEIGDEDSEISNQDLYCFTESGAIYRPITDGLWHYGKNDKVFFSNMTPNGNVEVIFGNGVYGAIPPVNEILHFVYASCTGAAANLSTLGLQVTLSDINENVTHRLRNTDTKTIDEQIEVLTNSLRGQSVSAIKDGDDRKDKEFYRVVGPSIRASNRRMVNRLDHYAQALRYPGIADVLFQGQKELAPEDRRFTNVIGITVLRKDGTFMTDEDWSLFTDYLTHLEIWGRGVEYFRIDPTPVYFDVSADVFMTNDSSLANVGSYLHYIFSDFFKIQRGSLSKSVFGSDLENMLTFKYADMTVDHVRNVLPDPAVDTILKKTQYPVLRSFDPSIQYSQRGARFVPPRIL